MADREQVRFTFTPSERTAENLVPGASAFVGKTGVAEKIEPDPEYPNEPEHWLIVDGDLLAAPFVYIRPRDMTDIQPT